MSYKDILLINTVTVFFQSILLLHLVIKDGKNNKNTDDETEKKVCHCVKSAEEGKKAS